MKKFLLFFLFLTTVSQFAFSHETQNQKTKILKNSISEQWENSEELILNENKNNDANFVFLEKYHNNIIQLEKIISQKKPDKKIIYYYPESIDYYNNLLNASKEIHKYIEETNLYSEKNSNVIFSQEFLQLRLNLGKAILDWEQVNSSIVSLQLKSITSMYSIFIIIIVVFVSLSIILTLLYRHSSEYQKQFVIKMIEAQEKERERISNELHDTVCQDMRLLQFKQEGISGAIDNSKKTELKEIIDYSKKISSDIRSICYDLTPTDLNEGLLPAIISLCQNFNENSNISLILSIQDEIKTDSRINNFSKEKNLHLYRILQELLNNIKNHSKAEEASILIRPFTENQFKIIISDDGIGFDLNKTIKMKNHFGIKNLMTRSKACDVQIIINTEAESGTQTTLIVPLT